MLLMFEDLPKKAEKNGALTLLEHVRTGSDYCVGAFIVEDFFLLLFHMHTLRFLFLFVHFYHQTVNYNLLIMRN